MVAPLVQRVLDAVALGIGGRRHAARAVVLVRDRTAIRLRHLRQLTDTVVAIGRRLGCAARSRHRPCRQASARRIGQGRHRALGIGFGLELAVRVVVGLRGAAERIRDLDPVAHAVVGVPRDTAQLVGDAGQIELVPALHARRVVGVLDLRQAVERVVLIPERVALGIGAAGNPTHCIVGETDIGLAVGIDHALQEAVVVVFPAGGLSQRVGFADLLSGRVVSVGRHLASRIAVGQRVVLVVVGVLGDRVDAQPIDAHDIDTIARIVIRDLLACCIDLAGDVPLRVIRQLDQFSRTVIAQATDLGWLLRWTDRAPPWLVGVLVPDTALLWLPGALDRTGRHMVVVFRVEPMGETRFRIVARALCVSLGVPIERVAIVHPFVEHVHPGRRLRVRRRHPGRGVRILDTLGLPQRIGDVDPALHPAFAIGELGRAVRRRHRVDERARVVAEARLHADGIGDVAQPAARVVAELRAPPERIGDLRDQQRIVRVAVTERGALAQRIRDRGQAQLSVVAQRHRVAPTIHDLRQEHPARRIRGPIRLPVHLFAAIAQATLVAGGRGAHQHRCIGRLRRKRARAGVVPALEHHPAAGHVAHHAAARAGRIVLHVAQPVRRPLRPEVEVREVRRLVRIPLVVRQREADRWPLRRSISDRRIDHVQADQHRMHVVARHAHARDTLQPASDIGCVGRPRAVCTVLGLAVACLGVVRRQARVIDRGGRPHAEHLLRLGLRDGLPTRLPGRLLGDQEVIAGLRLQRLLADPQVAAEGRVLQVVLPVLFRDDGRVVVDLPVHHRRQRNRRARAAAGDGVRQLHLLGELAHRIERHPVRAGADRVDPGDARAIRALELQNVLDRHRAAQIGDTRFVAHQPEAFARARNGFGGRTLQRTRLGFLQQRGHPIGVADAGMHAHQFAQRAVSQALGLRLRLRPGVPPRGFPGIHRAREVAQTVVGQAQVGAQGEAPCAVGILRQERLQRRERLGVAGITILLHGLPEGLLLLGAAGAGGDQGLLEHAHFAQACFQGSRARIGRDGGGCGNADAQRGQDKCSRNGVRKRPTRQGASGFGSIHGDLLF
uniref:Uncharacterized protein n=1 Tax=Ralstonia solanacearum TaxID=305 RepID=A0A0S4TW74_RALSL|nr:protein of unknown function [Ralstonia solanacearum]